MKLARLEGRPEIFYTIQGEGKSLGKPSIFVRTSLCNLHCIWCDTDYTWNWKGTKFQHVNDGTQGYEKFEKSEWIVELHASTVLEEINKFPCKSVVITGGEPLLQQKALMQLCEVLKNEGYWIEMETNGTIMPDTALASHVDQFNVSPKLENSNNPKNLRLKPKALDYFSKEEKSIFKFVINSEKDLEEVLEIGEEYGIPFHRIYLMPQGTLPEELNAKRLWLVDICKTYGFNFTDRLHIQLWGNKKGV